jgi:GntR family galactonate operon transcriptional repressor
MPQNAERLSTDLVDEPGSSSSTEQPRMAPRDIWNPPVDRPTRLATTVTEQILRRVAFGEFPPGSHLPTELELADQFKVSRTVIRESVRALEQKGVLSAKQGRGTVVFEQDQWSFFDPLVIAVRLETDTSTKLFTDLADIRMVIECQLAGAAARRAPDQLLEDIGSLVDEHATLTVSHPRYSELDVRFHDLIADASGNEIGRGIMTTLAPALRAMRVLTNAIPGCVEHTIEWHRRIHLCLLARDPEGASNAMTEHLRWSRDHLLSLRNDQHGEKSGMGRRRMVRDR